MTDTYYSPPDLFLAAEKADAAFTRTLIENGADVNVFDKHGQTPLFLTAKNTNEQVAQLLIENGADVNVRDKIGRTPLFLAAKNINEQVAQLLIENGADVNVRDKDGRTPLLLSANNNKEQIGQLLIGKGTDVNVSDEDGQLPLFLATENANQQIMQLLVEKGADVNVRDKDGRTPLFLVTKNANEQIVQLLVEKGANVNVPDEDGRTPLILAAENHKEEIARQLIENGAHVNVRDKYGRTPLFLAAKDANEQIAQLLIEKGADVNASDKYKQTPLLLAANNNKEQIARLLIEKGADVNVSDEDGRLPLFLATENANQQIVQLLVEKGANVNVRDKDGRTPLFLAVMTLEYDIMPSRSRERRYTPRTLITLRVTPSMQKALIRLLVENGANANLCDAKGQTPLYYTFCPEVLQMLLDHGANVHVRNVDEETVMINAVLRCKYADVFYNVASILVNSEATLNDADCCNVSVLSHLINRICQSNSFHWDTTFFQSKGVDNSEVLRSILSYLYAIVPKYHRSPNSVIKKDGKIIFSRALDLARTCTSSQVLAKLEALSDETETAQALDTLIQLGANPNHTDSDGNTALHHATLLPFYGISLNCTMEILRTLASHRIRFNIRNRKKETPLHFYLSNSCRLAKQYGTWNAMDTIEEICSFLITCASLINKTTKTGETLFHLIIKLFQTGLDMDDEQPRKVICNNLLKLLKLLSNMAFSQSIIFKRDDKGLSALHLWASLPLPQRHDYSQLITKNLTFQLLIETTLKCLLKPEMTPNPRDEEEQVPLHYCKTWIAVKLLIESGADANAVDKKRRTPLLKAAELNKLYLERGVFFPDFIEDKKTFFQECESLGLDIWSSDYNGRSILSILLKAESYVLATDLIDVVVAKCNSSTIIKQLVEALCKDTSTQTEWKSLLTQNLLTSRNLSQNFSLKEALGFVCKNISRHRRTQNYNNVFVGIARQLLFYGADGERLSKEFPELLSFLTSVISLEQVKKIIPWTSRSKRHKEKLELVSRKQKIEKIGTYYYHQQLIGQGTFGDVHVGICEKDAREVAIKKIKRSQVEKTVYEREKDILVKVADCQQVVSYIDFYDNDKDFVYIVLELMEGHLDNYIESRPSFDVTQSVHQCKEIVQGLRFLHQHKPFPILHRDLKPENILYKFDINGKLCLKIADFGLSSPLTTGRTTVLHSKAGTRCWIAPEVFKSTTYQHSTSSDIFSCGLVLHYILSPKKHPFEPRDCNNKSDQEIDLQTQNNMSSHKLEGWHDELSPEASHLIKDMLQQDESQRPSAADALRHPFFWSDKKKLDFICAVGNQHVFECPPDIKTACHYTTTGVEAALDANFANIVKHGSWDNSKYKGMAQVVAEMKRPIAKVNKKGKKKTDNPRTYDTGSIVELVRFIRNTVAHVSEQSRPQEIQKLILEDAVFLKEFPNLLIEVYVAVTMHGWDTREEIKYVMTSEEQDL